MTNAVEKSPMTPSIRNTIRAMEFLNRCCAFPAALESMLLAQVR
jgi:hypothetical protein